MKFDATKSKMVAVILITLGIFVIASNTYNSIASTGLIDVEGVLKSSFTSLLSIVGGITTVMAQNRNANGDLLSEDEKKIEASKKSQIEINNE
jgi:uncharacterized Tic20 family protein